jgi:hypothetical protein
MIHAERGRTTVVDTLKLSPEVFRYARDPSTLGAGIPASDD